MGFNPPHKTPVNCSLRSLSLSPSLSPSPSLPPPCRKGVIKVSYLFSQSADVSLEGGVHPVERLGFAEVLAHVVGQLLLLVVDLSHQLLPVVKVPEETEEEKRGGDKSWIITTLV